MKKCLVIGDYVLGTLWPDGDPCDPHAVGYVEEIGDDKRAKVRFMYKGHWRTRWFLRCERISQRVGEALCKAFPIISDKRGRSLWYWRRRVGELEKLINNAT